MKTKIYATPAVKGLRVGGGGGENFFLWNLNIPARNTEPYAPAWQVSSKLTTPDPQCNLTHQKSQGKN